MLLFMQNNDKNNEAYKEKTTTAVRFIQEHSVKTNTYKTNFTTNYIS